MRTSVRATDERQRVLGWVLVGSLFAMLVAAAMIVIGDPIWNLYVIWLGMFVAPPVALVVGILLLLSRRRSPTGP
jgi:hypothetical protein